MTRKDYERIASTIMTERENIRLSTAPGTVAQRVALQATTSIALSLADTFAEDNDRFDRTRFLRACGVTGKDLA